MEATVRIALVDDYEPWRQFIRSTLKSQPHFQIVADVGDGLTAVQRAQELKPELIILDIGLPDLNGIEVARRIRKVSPNSKILFASANRSWEIVEEGLRTGADGYLVKTNAALELLPAIEAILQGGQFISSSLAAHKARGVIARDDDRSQGRRDAPVPRQNTTKGHELEIYLDDAALANGFSRLIEAALNVETSVIVIDTDSHHAQILHMLQINSVNVDAAIEKGSFISIRAADALAAIMVNNMPDRSRCASLVGDLIARSAKAASGAHPRVKICGECAPVLLTEGNSEAAIQLEHLWDEIISGYEVDTLCGYLGSAFTAQKRSSIFRRICAEHSAVHGRELGS